MKPFIKPVDLGEGAQGPFGKRKLKKGVLTAYFKKSDMLMMMQLNRE